MLAIKRSIRHFSYDVREIQRLNAKLQRKINILKMFTDHKKYNYQQPKMTYDKASGEVTIHDPKDDIKANRIINNIDEVIEEKQKLYEELGLDEKGYPKEPIGLEELSEKYKIIKK